MITFIKPGFQDCKNFYQILLRLHYLIIVCISGTLIQPGHLFAERAWKLFQEDNELTVYTRKAEACIESEFKAVVVIHQPIKVVKTVLMDIPAYCKWIEGCTDVKLLNKTNDSNCEVYFAISMPWPFYNRDVIYRIKSYATAEGQRMTVRGIAIEKAGVLIKEGHVRVIDAYFNVALEKITHDRTKIIYHSKTDASFNMPHYMTRTICGNMVYNSMVNLRRLFTN